MTGLVPNGLVFERATPGIKLVPAKRFGDASEIANAVVFLASDEANFAVGSELMIDVAGHS